MEFALHELLKNLIFAFTGQLTASTRRLEWLAAADQTVTFVAMEQHEACGRQLQGPPGVWHKILQVRHLWITQLELTIRRNV